MLVNNVDRDHNPHSEYACERVWDKYDKPTLRRWIWTVKDPTALLILANLTLLTVITQTRIWAIARHIILTRKGIQPAKLELPPPPSHLQITRVNVTPLEMGFNSQ